jgi:hypothetical protein
MSSSAGSVQGQCRASSSRSDHDCKLEICTEQFYAEFEELPLMRPLTALGTTHPRCILHGGPEAGGCPGHQHSGGLTSVSPPSHERCLAHQVRKDGTNLAAGLRDPKSAPVEGSKLLQQIPAPTSWKTCNVIAEPGQR